jgi:hypothetical protein
MHVIKYADLRADEIVRYFKTVILSLKEYKVVPDAMVRLLLQKLKDTGEGAGHQEKFTSLTTMTAFLLHQGYGLHDCSAVIDDLLQLPLMESEDLLAEQYFNINAIVCAAIKFTTARQDLVWLLNKVNDAGYDDYVALAISTSFTNEPHDRNSMRLAYEEATKLRSPLGESICGVIAPVIVNMDVAEFIKKIPEMDDHAAVCVEAQKISEFYGSTMPPLLQRHQVGILQAYFEGGVTLLKEQAFEGFVYVLELLGVNVESYGHCDLASSEDRRWVPEIPVLMIWLVKYCDSASYNAATHKHAMTFIEKRIGGCSFSFWSVVLNVLRANGSVGGNFISQDYSALDDCAKSLSCCDPINDVVFIDEEMNKDVCDAVTQAWKTYDEYMFRFYTKEQCQAVMVDALSEYGCLFSYSSLALFDLNISEERAVVFSIIKSGEQSLFVFEILKKTLAIHEDSCLSFVNEHTEYFKCLFDDVASYKMIIVTIFFKSDAFFDLLRVEFERLEPSAKAGLIFSVLQHGVHGPRWEFIRDQYHRLESQEKAPILYVLLGRGAHEYGVLNRLYTSADDDHDLKKVSTIISRFLDNVDLGEDKKIAAISWLLSHNVSFKTKLISGQTIMAYLLVNKRWDILERVRWSAVNTKNKRFFLQAIAAHLNERNDRKACEFIVKSLSDFPFDESRSLYALSGSDAMHRNHHRDWHEYKQLIGVKGTLSLFSFNATMKKDVHLAYQTVSIMRFKNKSDRDTFKKQKISKSRVGKTSEVDADHAFYLVWMIHPSVTEDLMCAPAEQGVRKGGVLAAAKKDDSTRLKRSKKSLTGRDKEKQSGRSARSYDAGEKAGLDAEGPSMHERQAGVGAGDTAPRLVRYSGSRPSAVSSGGGLLPAAASPVMGAGFRARPMRASLFDYVAVLPKSLKSFIATFAGLGLRMSEADDSYEVHEKALDISGDEAVYRHVYRPAIIALFMQLCEEIKSNPDLSGSVEVSHQLNQIRNQLVHNMGIDSDTALSAPGSQLLFQLAAECINAPHRIGAVKGVLFKLNNTDIVATVSDDHQQAQKRYNTSVKALKYIIKRLLGKDPEARGSTEQRLRTLLTIADRTPELYAVYYHTMQLHKSRSSLDAIASVTSSERAHVDLFGAGSPGAKKGSGRRRRGRAAKSQGVLQDLRNRLAHVDDINNPLSRDSADKLISVLLTVDKMADPVELLEHHSQSTAYKK